MNGVRSRPPKHPPLGVGVTDANNEPPTNRIHALRHEISTDETSTPMGDRA